MRAEPPRANRQPFFLTSPFESSGVLVVARHAVAALLLLALSLSFLTLTAHPARSQLTPLACRAAARIDEVTDSELLALAASKVDFSSAAELVERLREIVMKANATKGALNLLTMVVDPRSASVSLACLEEHPHVNEKYYAMFSFSRGDFKAFMSSTVAYYAGLVKSDLSISSGYVNRCPLGEVVEA